MNDGYYLCFTLSTSDADARAAYARRYGQQPEKVTRDQHFVWTGPIPDEARQAWARRQMHQEVD